MPSKDEISNEHQEIVDSLDKFWKQEAAGLVDTEDRETDSKVQESETGIQFEEGRYMAMWPGSSANQ